MATNSNSDDLSSTDSSSNNSSLNDDCICQNVWEEFLNELGSFKEFLEDVITDHPSIHRNALRELRIFQQEYSRRIDNLIEQICEKCGKHHTTVHCKNESENYIQSRAGCNARNHHVLL